jgi:hypothetical protein
MFFLEPLGVGLMPKDIRKPIETLICYSHFDENFHLRLKTYLEDEEYIGTISSVVVDQEDKSVETKLKSIIPSLKLALLLISPTFLEQNFANSEQMKILLSKHKRGQLRLIPIILHPVNWRNSPLSELLALPRENRPVVMWPSERNAWQIIIQSIRLICEELQSSSNLFRPFAQLSLFDEHLESRSILSDEFKHLPSLYNVFVTQGPPTVTFIEPVDFDYLKIVLLQPGRGIIIEGPSGVGKTTAWTKAIESLPPHRKIQELINCDATDGQVRSELKTLRKWHKGTVIIDDFHKLDKRLREDIADYMKSLADKRSISKKLVLVGIPNTGKSLVHNAPDLIGRVDIFPYGRVDDKSVSSMIEAGETALNIIFDHKGDIVNVANGNLSIAQSLCFFICSMNKVMEKQEEPTLIHCDMETSVLHMKKQLLIKYDEPIKNFAKMDGSKNTICLEILEALAYSGNGILQLNYLQESKPYLKRGIELFINYKWIDHLIRKHEGYDKLFFFNDDDKTLIIDDPRLIFCLQQTHFSNLAAEIGKASSYKKVFICYSHEDAPWLKQLKRHLKHLQQVSDIEIWDDTRIKPGQNWKEEIRKAIEPAKVVVILVSPNLISSDFNNEHTLPTILSKARNEGTRIIPIITTPCLLTGSGLEHFKPINPTHRNRNEFLTLTSMTSVARNNLFVEVAKAIKAELTSYRDYNN